MSEILWYGSTPRRWKRSGCALAVEAAASTARGPLREAGAASAVLGGAKRVDHNLPAIRLPGVFEELSSGPRKTSVLFYFCPIRLGNLPVGGHCGGRSRRPSASTLPARGGHKGCCRLDGAELAPKNKVTVPIPDRERFTSEGSRQSQHVIFVPRDQHLRQFGGGAGADWITLWQ